MVTTWTHSMNCKCFRSLGCFAFSVAVCMFVTAQRWKMGHVYTLGGILMPKVLLLESLNAHGVLSLSLPPFCLHSPLYSPFVSAFGKGGLFSAYFMNIPSYKTMYYVKSSFKYFLLWGALFDSLM